MASSAGIPISDVEGEDLFPTDDAEKNRLIRWVEERFKESQDARRLHEARWQRFYIMYRSFVKRRPKGDWRSRAWMPIAFYIIETITPRLVAQLPKFAVQPIGPEDVEPARAMEELLEWASDRSELYIELVKALKSSLLYGTGILKILYDEKTAYSIRQEPVMEETTIDVPIGQTDLEGQPMSQTVPGGQQPVVDPETGQPVMQSVREAYTAYAGPVAEAVDIENFFVDPVADSIETSRYVIHRVYRDRDHLEQMFKQGVYKRPDEDLLNRFLTSHSSINRQASVELGPGSVSQYDRNLFAILEVWTDDFVVAVLGEGDTGGASILLRADRNPFAHGEMPFVRIVDHLVPHEFWGIGELEPLEGIQDLINSLWNSRIDNVKIVMNSMFMAVTDYLQDPADLVVRPGGIIRVKEGLPVEQVVRPVDLGEVTQSSYEEVEALNALTEKVSGVSPYQTGADSPAYNRTATGISLISEQGNTRFTHKARIAELTGYKRLARQYAAVLQQFIPPELILRIQGPLGQFMFQQIDQSSIMGRFDFEVEAESALQTESVRRDQALNLFQLLAADPFVRPLKLREDILRVFGKRDIQNYVLSEQELQQMLQAQSGEAEVEAEEA